MQETAPTLRSLATRLGISVMTVSRALRGSPHKVSSATRAKVEQAAREMGYQVNPAVSTLMSSIRKRTVKNYRGKLAWLDTGHTTSATEIYPWNLPRYEGVRLRSEQSGFLLENVWIDDPSVPAARLTTVLLARGIQGIIIAASPHPSLDFIDWEQFACATTQTTIKSPAVHLASSDGIHGMVEALTHLKRLGYRRIGLMLNSIHNRQRQRVDQAILVLENSFLPAKNRVPVLLLPMSNPERQPELFVRWVGRYRPDVVICYDEYVLEWATSQKLSVPEDLGLVHLNRHHYLTRWAGIDQHEDQIGAAAVDLIVGQLIRGERGIPPFRKEVLIQGKWVGGSTVRAGAC